MLTSASTSVKQSGNGIIVAFDFQFKILAATDLQVFKIDANNNQSSPLILNTDYTVAFDPIAENGTVTYTVAPTAGGFSLITRVSDSTQQTSMPREGVAPAKTVETMVDKTTALIQELQTALAATQFTATNGLTLKLTTFNAADGLAGATPFLLIATDTHALMFFTGNRSYGGNGWIVLGGF